MFGNEIDWRSEDLHFLDVKPFKSLRRNSLVDWIITWLHKKQTSFIRNRKPNVEKKPVRSLFRHRSTSAPVMKITIMITTTMMMTNTKKKKKCQLYRTKKTHTERPCAMTRKRPVNVFLSPPQTRLFKYVRWNFISYTGTIGRRELICVSRSRLEKADVTLWLSSLWYHKARAKCSNQAFIRVSLGPLTIANSRTSGHWKPSSVEQWRKRRERARRREQERQKQTKMYVKNLVEQFSDRMKWNTWNSIEINRGL